MKNKKWKNLRVHVRPYLLLHTTYSF